MPFDQRSLIHREPWFPPCFVRQNQQKKSFFCAAIFDNFQQKCPNPRPLLTITFPQGFRISKNIGHPTSGSGCKKTFKRYLKSEHTNRRTNRRSFRLIGSIGPEGRCFENGCWRKHQQWTIPMWHIYNEVHTPASAWKVGWPATFSLFLYMHAPGKTGLTEMRPSLKSSLNGFVHAHKGVNSEENSKIKKQRGKNQGSTASSILQ